MAACYLCAHSIVCAPTGDKLLAHCYNGQYHMFNTKTAHTGPVASYGNPSTYARNAHTWCVSPDNVSASLHCDWPLFVVFSVLLSGSTSQPQNLPIDLAERGMLLSLHVVVCCNEALLLAPYKRRADLAVCHGCNAD
jgi:hypothetical protein